MIRRDASALWMKSFFILLGIIDGPFAWQHLVGAWKIEPWERMNVNKKSRSSNEYILNSTPYGGMLIYGSAVRLFFDIFNLITEKFKNLDV